MSYSRCFDPLVVSVVSVTTTLAAIVMLCMETMPAFARPRCDRPSSLDPFFVGETVCTTWFTLELFIRLASCPSKRTFFFDFKNAVDLVAILPYYIGLWFEGGDDQRDAAGSLATGCRSLPGGEVPAPETGVTLTFLRVIRLVRVVRIMKLTKYSFGLQVCDS